MIKSRVNNKFLSKNDLSTFRDNYKDSKIVLCHGVFDVLHHGHLLHFKSAKKYGDILVISLTGDEFVNKGPNRPFNNEISRMKFLSELEIVDFVYINKSKNAIPIIKSLKPHFYIKGPDYKDKKKDRTKGIIQEEKAIKSVKGKIKFTNDDIKSSSKLINQVFSSYDEEQLEVLKDIKSKYSFLKIEAYLNRIKDKKILLVGEPIIDEYVFTQPLGLGSKSPIISSKILYREKYDGGVLAIAKNLEALRCKFKLLIPYPKNKSKNKLTFPKSIEKFTKKILINDWTIPLKTRYVSEFQAQKIFETNEINENLWSQKGAIQEFQKSFLKNSEDCDVIIIADFGHGFFNKDLLMFINKFKNKKKFINVQTNSANLGFNFYNKYKHYNYLSIDERELRLALSDNSGSLDNIIKASLKNKKLMTPLSITLGKKGSMFIKSPTEKYFCPSYFRNVLDTTGAGDAYFILSSLLYANGCPSMLIPFISNLYAGLNTKHLANRDPISIIDLERALKGIML